MSRLTPHSAKGTIFAHRKLVSITDSVLVPVRRALGRTLMVHGASSSPRARRTVVPILLAVAALAVTACGGGSSSGGSHSGGATGTLAAPGLYGKLPPATTPTHGGTLTWGQLSGQTP